MFFGVKTVAYLGFFKGGQIFAGYYCLHKAGPNHVFLFFFLWLKINICLPKRGMAQCHLNTPLGEARQVETDIVFKNKIKSQWRNLKTNTFRFQLTTSRIPSAGACHCLSCSMPETDTRFLFVSNHFVARWAQLCTSLIQCVGGILFCLVNHKCTPVQMQGDIHEQAPVNVLYLEKSIFRSSANLKYENYCEESSILEIDNFEK